MSNGKNEDRKPLEYYLGLHYPITLYPEEAGGFTVEVKDLPGCLSQGETVEEAYEMIAEAKELWLEVAHDYGDPIPLPSTETEYSGKTMLRMPTYLHEKLARHAKEQGTSLNQYLVSLLSERDSLNVVRSVKDELAELKAILRSQEKSQAQDQGQSAEQTSSTPQLAAEKAADYKTSDKTSEQKVVKA